MGGWGEGGWRKVLQRVEELKRWMWAKYNAFWEAWHHYANQSKHNIFWTLRTMNELTHGRTEQKWTHKVTRIIIQWITHWWARDSLNFSWKSAWPTLVTYVVEIQTERAACSLQYSLAVRSLFPNLRASGQDAYRNLSLLVKSRIIIISATASVRVRESTRRSFSDTWSFSTFRIWKLNERNDKLKRSLISTSSFPSQSKSSALTAERQFNVIFSRKSDITFGFLIMLCPAVFFWQPYLLIKRQGASKNEAVWYVSVLSRRLFPTRFSPLISSSSPSPSSARRSWTLVMLDGLFLSLSTDTKQRADASYRLVQLNFTPEMAVFYKLLVRCHSKNWKISLKQHIKYFNTRRRPGES